MDHHGYGAVRIIGAFMAWRGQSLESLYRRPSTSCHTSFEALLLLSQCAFLSCIV